MKIKLYTKGHRMDLLSSTSGDGRFTAQEHAFAMEQEHASEYRSRAALLSWYLGRNSVKLASVGFLIDRLSARGPVNVVSLGAGPGVLEHLLKCGLPLSSNVVATDFDGFMVERAKTLFPDLVAARFDFFADDPGELARAVGLRLDVAVFWGSAYVMDDSEFIRVFSGLKSAGVREIYDFHAGYMNWKSHLLNLPPLSQLRRSALLRRALGKPAVADEADGKFHGYSRTRGELRRLYATSGLALAEELALAPYEYVAVCRC